MSKSINWDDAMNQVGGDRDFLEEVLGDLMTEAETADQEISAVIEGPNVTSEDFLTVKKAAHRIKGSASYLCCEDLRSISEDMQVLGDRGATKADDDHAATLREIKVKFALYRSYIIELKQEVKKNLQNAGKK